jgi:RNA polymerase sigma-70 factor (ECF subfamily)
LDDVEDSLRATLLLALAGDNEAYAAFLTRSSALVRVYFRRRLAAFPDDVEDLVQETLLALHNQRHTYRPAQPLTPWLYAIARYKLVDLLRAQAPRRALEVPFDPDDDACLHQSPGSESGARESRRDLLKLLATLPDRHRLPIELVKIEGRTVAEAAVAIGISESAVKIGIHRGLKKLALEAGKRR